jgi:hypothetical protein
MKNSSLSESNPIADKMKINLDMLGPLMLNGVVGEVHGADVVAVHDGGLGGRPVKFLQQLT